MPAISFGRKIEEAAGPPAASVGLPRDYLHQVQFFKVPACMFSWRESKRSLMESASKASIISISSFSDRSTGAAFEAAAIPAARLPSSLSPSSVPTDGAVSSANFPAAPAACAEALLGSLDIVGAPLAIFTRSVCGPAEAVAFAADPVCCRTNGAAALFVDDVDVTNHFSGVDLQHRGRKPIRSSNLVL